mmetsp:Transcript_55734/g.84350  ORF Transcript_55734/g.84350 Transcript_55734/m.84350 type:complete len:160 (-) Transcript_55734:124-603(-)
MVSDCNQPTSKPAGDQVEEEVSPPDEDEEDARLLEKLVKLLQDRVVYSWSMQHCCTELGVPKEKIEKLVERRKEQAVDKMDRINIFYWGANDVFFVGLESRRIDYEEDAKIGKNHIHNELLAGTRGVAAREAALAEEKTWRETPEDENADLYPECCAIL